MSKLSNLPDAEPRLIIVNGDKLGIKTYGPDNGYPQRMLNLYNASGSAKMCANLCAAYLIGKGFEDLVFYSSVVNGKGITPDKLLRRVAHDKSKFRGFALHVNWNSIYEVDSVSYVPFEYCREGINENEGKIGVFKEWYKPPGAPRSKTNTEPTFIPLYNPDPVGIESQVNEAGGWENYKGQIYYISDDFETYPLATIDPVIDDVLAEIESSITRKNNLRNNFQLKHIWVEKGQVQEDEQEEEIVDGIRQFMGPDGKPISVVFSKDPEGKDIPELVPVTSSINDKLFQYTDQTARLSIYTQFGQPAVLHSDYLGASGFNEGQLPQSMDYYNSLTEPDRILLEEVFSEIFKRYKDKINPSNSYRITALESLKAGGNDIKVEEEDKRALIEIIGVGGTQALQSILADPATTADQKKNTLIIVFGLSEENASLLAGVTTSNE